MCPKKGRHTMPVTRFPNGISGASTQTTAVAPYVITWTLNEPTAGDAATIADGDLVAGTELGQAIADLTAKVNLLSAALLANGITA